ncbi:hypothetical protein PIIN_08229 [Serendipita indica DSM 11827]|uniref:Uncharacterized protein n=1 Tax=Serendipita indica (strain DSM 11827) TaxID=1109443 RepID=G4TSH8_SERID|nr:hypothetical protein PIIN_08229 [Serendipita indica DSM 11827]
MSRPREQLLVHRDPRTSPEVQASMPELCDYTKYTTWAEERGARFLGLWQNNRQRTNYMRRSGARNRPSVLRYPLVVTLQLTTASSRIWFDLSNFNGTPISGRKRIAATEHSSGHAQSHSSSIGNTLPHSMVICFRWIMAGVLPVGQKAPHLGVPPG